MKRLFQENHITSEKLLSTTTLFLLSAPLIILSYGIFVFNPHNADNILLYGLQVIADIIAILALLGLWITVLLDVIVERHHRSHRVTSNTFLIDKKPTIDIFITTAGEPIEIITKTVEAAMAMEYPHHTFVLDDGRSQEVKALATATGATYISRRDRTHAKAGNVNSGLRFGKSEFFSILDADQVPKKDFILKLLPYMSNGKLAMVQSPQYFANTESFIAAGTAQSQEVFYKYVCPAKNVSNSAFCVGTNMVFRRKAINEIGGIAQNHSEDIWTSYLLHEKGWHTLFVNEVLAVGEAPATIISYFKQQRRWAKGGLDMLISHNPLRSRHLNLDQKVQYFMSNTYFLVGISIFAYVMMPILYLLFDVKPLNTENGLTWALHYIPYFILYYMLSYLFLGRLHLATLSTAVASFYPYLLALISAVFETEQEWVATTAKKAQKDTLMKWIWPHVLIIFLGLLSIIVGWYEPTNFWTTLFNTIWVSVNTYLLYLFVTGENRMINSSDVIRH